MSKCESSCRPVFIMLRYIRVCIMKECWILSNSFYASILMMMWFYFSYCCSLSHLLVCICWTILASQQKLPFIYDMWSFHGVFKFRLLIFCWEFLHVCNQASWLKIFFSCNILILILSMHVILLHFHFILPLAFLPLSFYLQHL